MKILKNFRLIKLNNHFFSNKTNSNRVEYSYDTSDFLNNYHNYEDKLDDKKKQISFREDSITGYATENGTLAFSNRNKQEVHGLNFRNLYDSEIKISSIGIGTYIGPPDDINDFYMYNAIKSVIMSGGVNVIDTAINYRYMKSEKTIGKALKALIDKYDYNREEFFICSKIGFVPEDASSGKRSHAFVQNLVENNKIEMDDIIFDEKNRPVHCIHPEFLNDQLNNSLSNLNLSTLDVMYLHNVYETQGAIIQPELFESRLSKAFEFLESARNEGKIRYYGLATWNSLRTTSDNRGLYCNLQDIVELAERIGGNNHGMRFVQVPINIMHPEAFVENYQNYKKEDKGVTAVTLTAVCNSLKINLISSSPLMQGYIVNLPLENNLFNVKNQSAKHIQLIRSIPAECIKSTLIGMKNQIHIRNNLEVISKPPLTSKEFYDILAPKRRAAFIEKEIDQKK